MNCLWKYLRLLTFTYINMWISLHKHTFRSPLPLWWLLYLWLYGFLCMGMHRWLQCPPRPEKSVRPLELDSPVAVHHLMWVLGMKSGPLQQQCALVIPRHLSAAIILTEKRPSALLELDDLGDWQQWKNTAVTMKECSWPGFCPDNVDVRNKLFVKSPNDLPFWSNQCHWLISGSSPSNPSNPLMFMFFSFSTHSSLLSNELKTS